MPRLSRSTRRPAGLAKLTPPTLPLVLERPRLYRRLDHARKNPIIWITGPPGAGKTTLVASYLRARRVRPLWYNLDERDGDLATFFHYLGLAAKQAAPRIRRSLPHLTPEYLLGLPIFTRNFFDSLAGRLKPSAVLVFDNYQQIPTDSQFHELLQVGVSELPRGMAVIVVSRQLPPPAFAGLEAAQLIEVIEPEALRLTEREFDGILRLRAGRERWKPSKTMRDELHRRVQGWVAGLILVLGRVKAGEREVVFLRDKQPEVVFEYLASQSLRGLSHETQTFLLKTAQLPVMTVGMAEKLTGSASAGEMLTKLHRARYFMERREEAQIWYQYHSLFREFLLARSTTVFQPDELRMLKRTAATLLADAGRTEDAMHLWQEAGEADELITLILAQAPALMAQGRAQTLEGWLQRLSQRLIEQHPWLLFWRGSCLMPIHLPEAEGIFARAFAEFKTRGDRMGTLLAWCSAVEAILYTWKDFSRLDLWLDEVADVHPEQMDSFPPEVQTRLIIGIFLAHLWRRPQDPRCHQWLSYASTVIDRTEDPIQLATLSFHVITAWSWFGEGSQIRTLCEVVRQRFNQAVAPPLAQLMFICGAKVLHAWHTGQPALGIQALAEAKRIASDSGIHFLDDPILSLSIYLLLLDGNVDEAERVMAQRTDLEGAEEFRGIEYSFKKAYLAMLRGNPERAWSHMHRVSESALANSSPFWVSFWSLASAEILYACGKTGEARQSLARGNETRRGLPSHLLAFIAHLVEARLSLDTGQEAEGLQALKHAFEIGRKQGLVDACWWIPSTMSHLCAKALEQGIETEYVQFLIRKRKLAPPSPAPDAWPWPIRIRCLGRFEILLDGQLLQFGRKIQHRPVALLKALVAGGRVVRRDTLMDALWPEADGDAATAALHTTIARLRKLLRHDSAIEIRDGNVHLDERTCYVDVWTFDRLVVDADVAKQAGDLRRWTHLSEQAFHLYHGPFLDDDLQAPWTHPMRDRLRGKFTRLVASLCEHWDKTGEPELAARCREEAVSVDAYVIVDRR